MSNKKKNLIILICILLFAVSFCIVSVVLLLTKKSSALTITSQDFIINVGSSQKISYTVSKPYAHVTFKSENSDVAYIDSSNIVHAVSCGTTQIVIEAKYKNEVATDTITATIVEGSSNNQSSQPTPPESEDENKTDNENSDNNNAGNNEDNKNDGNNDKSDDNKTDNGGNDSDAELGDSNDKQGSIDENNPNTDEQQPSNPEQDKSVEFTLHEELNCEYFDGKLYVEKGKTAIFNVKIIENDDFSVQVALNYTVSGDFVRQDVYGYTILTESDFEIYIIYQERVVASFEVVCK